MKTLMKTIFIIVISSGISTLLLNQLYKINSSIISFIHKIPEKWKGKWLIRWIVVLFFMIIVSIIVVIGGLDDIIGTIIIGFIISLTDLTLSKPKKIN